MRIVSRLLAALIAAAALTAPIAVPAQTVVPLPVYVDNTQGAVKDLGNGPTEVKVLNGSAQLFTMSSSGVGQTTGGVSSTAVTLTATPATPPCVGCVISGTAITSGTTVTATSTTSITLSAAMAVATSTTLSWGAACPSTFSSAPGGSILVQAGVGGDLPLYTQARVCAAGQFAAGATLLQFPIGAH